MKEYLVLTLPPSAKEATMWLNKHAAVGWAVVGTLSYSEMSTGVIMEREARSYPPYPTE